MSSQVVGARDAPVGEGGRGAVAGAIAPPGQKAIILVQEGIEKILRSDLHKMNLCKRLHKYLGSSVIDYQKSIIFTWRHTIMQSLENHLVINDLSDELLEELSDEVCGTIAGGGLWSSFKKAVKDKKNAIIDTGKGLLRGELPSGETADNLVTPIPIATLENWGNGF
jgi:hypothetical protein